MPRYRLYLHDGPTTPPEHRDIEDSDDGDADDMARITLLSTTDFTHVEIWKDDTLILTHNWDSYHPEA